MEWDRDWLELTSERSHYRWPEQETIMYRCYLFLALLLFTLKSESENWSHCRVWLCDPMDCSLPGSSVHGLLQATVLEWVAISFSRESSQPRDQTWVSCIAGRFFCNWATSHTIYCNQFNFQFLLRKWSL